MAANAKLGLSCITHRYPEVDNQDGVVLSVPTYPNTRVTVRLPNLDNRVIKVSTAAQVAAGDAPFLLCCLGRPGRAPRRASALPAPRHGLRSPLSLRPAPARLFMLPPSPQLRSSNFRINEEGVGAYVQTERLSRSMFFNQLREGMEIVLLDCARKDLPSGDDPEQHGERAVIVKVPVYPSTWLTARKNASGKMVKVRTSKIAMPRDAPQLSEETVFTALRQRPPASKVRRPLRFQACSLCPRASKHVRLALAHPYLTPSHPL